MITQMKRLFGFLWPFCKKNKKYFYFLTVFIFLAAALELPLPLFLKYFIDHIIKNKDLHQLQLFSILLVSLILLKFIVDNLRRYFLFSFKERTFMDLQGFVFDKVLKVKYKFFEENNTGYVVSRMHNELLQLQRFLWDFFVKILTDVLLFCFGIYFIFRYSTRLALISLSLLPFFIATLKIFSKKIKERENFFHEEYSKLFGFFYEIINMMFLVKVLVLYEYAKKKLEVNLGNLFKVKQKRIILNELFSTIITLIGALSPIIVLYFGGLEIINNRLSLGALIAFNSFLAYIFGPSKNILNYGVELLSTLVSFNRIMEILKLGEEKYDSTKLEEIERIQFENVSFSYTGSPVLKNVTFEVKKGEILGIFGKIGSGKSTIIKLLLGLYDDYTGKIMVNNSSFSNMAAIRERVGVIPQDSYLFNESIVENVKIANTKCEPADIDNIIKRLELDQLIERKGANHKISPDGSDLSGGERQKIAAARLIFKNPDVVIIDEGTSNLDAHSEYVIKEEIFEYFKERIIIIISHRFNNIILCDRIIYLKEGKIVDIDSHMNLFEKYADYKELYLKQEKRGQKKKKVTMP